MKETKILEKVDPRRLLDESSIVVKTNDTEKSRDSKKTKSTKDTKSIKNLNRLKETYKKIIFKYLVENMYRNQNFKK